MTRRVYHGSNRRERMKQVADGPGYFVYNGKAVDSSWEPTPKLRESKEVAVSDDGRIMRNGTVPVYTPAGTPVLLRGQIVLGGEPIVTEEPIDVFKLWGVEFPTGKKILVEDTTLARKLRRMEHFDEVGEEDVEKKKIKPPPVKSKEAKE